MIPQYEPLIKKEYIDAVSQQICSGWIGTSKKTEEFEEEICKLTGSSHCIATTSGTVAIMMGIYSLNLPAGSTILFPAYSFLAGANAARFLGFNIKLVDIKPETMCMNPDKIVLSDDVSAVMFVNHNGYAGEDLQAIRAICDSYNIAFIEDSAQALGIHKAGRTGDFGIFSFSVPKIITTGQGGVVITDNKQIYERCRQVRDHGDNWRGRRLHDHLGINLKFNDILAAFGLVQLTQLPELLEKRKNIFNHYRKYLRIKDFGYDSTWMVIYETKNSDKIIDKLKDNEIQAVKYYRPINHNEMYKDGLVYEESERAFNNCVYLPSSLTLTENDIENICRIIITNE